MNPPNSSPRRFPLASLLGLSLAALLVSCRPTEPPAANETTNAPAAATTTNAVTPPATNPPAGTSTNALAGAASPNTNATPTAATVPPGGPGGPGTPGAPGSPPAPGEPIQVAFQGAGIDMIVQWLAQTTGKTVVKSPRVQCQLTIVSSKKVLPREALELVYRALALEGFNAIETRTSIFLVPEGQDLKLSPEIMTAATTDIPEGRQRLIKMFPLTHLPAGDVRDKIRGVLSDKGTAELDERTNGLIVTDFNDNLRLVGELIKELDVTSIGDAVVEIFALKHAEAEEFGNLISLILNAQSSGTATTAGGGGRSSGASGGPPPGMPGMPMGGSSPPSGGPGAGGGSGASGGGNPLQVRIWPDRSANRLIVATPKSKLPEVRQLIELLDTSKPGDVTVRVLPLKRVQAIDLVKELQPLYQKMNTRSPKDTVEIAANERSNSLIVLSSEASYKLVSEFVASLDTEDAQEKVIRTFTLRNADAQDVAKQLQDLNVNEDSNASRFRVFYFGGEAPGASKRISVVADRRRNSVIVQAPPAQMEAIASMVRELDEPVGEDSLAPRIFALKYVSAVDIQDVLDELFLKKQQRRPYWFDDEFDSGSADRDVGRLYGKVRITSEPYSNTLIVTANSKENLQAVEEILKQLDVPSTAGETTVLVPLRYATATTLANSLNIVFAKNGSPPIRPNQPQQPQNPNQAQPQPQSSGAPAQSSFELNLEAREEGYFPWLGGQPDSPRGADGRTTTRQVSDLVGRVRVVADERSNALLVSANLHLLPQILKLVDEMDAPTAQVLIEARILEVATDKLDKFGVRWSPDGSQVYSGDDYDMSILGTMKGRYVTGFGGNTEVNNPSAGEIGAAITSLRSGVFNSTVSLDVLVQFLRRTTDATVLAEPQINISDNEMGRLFVGQQVPFIDKSQTTDQGGLNQSFQYKLVGVILEVTPHINQSGDVSLRIRAESSSIQPSQVVSGGPVVDTRNFRTDVTAKSGEILLLGGIIQKQISDTIRKVPVLGDIPGLGWAFKKKDQTARNVELMVFLRPKITRTPEEARALVDELDTRAPLIAPWKHGGSPADATPVTPPAPAASPE